MKTTAVVLNYTMGILLFLSFIFTAIIGEATWTMFVMVSLIIAQSVFNLIYLHNN